MLPAASATADRSTAVTITAARPRMTARASGEEISGDKAPSLPRLAAMGERVGIGGVVAALSVASDLTRGHPPGEAMRACLLATELARRGGLDRVVASARSTTGR